MVAEEEKEERRKEWRKTTKHTVNDLPETVANNSNNNSSRNNHYYDDNNERPQTPSPHMPHMSLLVGCRWVGGTATKIATKNVVVVVVAAGRVVGSRGTEKGIVARREKRRCQ